MSPSRSGQLFASDLIASVIVFFFIVNISLIIWNIAYENKTAFNDERQMRERVVRSSDLLVRTPGYPNDWDNESVRLAGFSTKDHVLDNDKLRAFNDTPYDKQQDAIRAQEYDYHLNITVGGQTVVLQEPGKTDMPLTFGNADFENADTRVVNRRTVLVNASNQIERATLKLVFWR